MNNLFNISLFQQIISGLVVLLVSILLGSKMDKTATKGNGWKVIVIFAWIMILGGFYMFGLGISSNGLHNSDTGIGLGLIVVGLFLKYIGRFFIWWHR